MNETHTFIAFSFAIFISFLSYLFYFIFFLLEIGMKKAIHSFIHLSCVLCWNSWAQKVNSSSISFFPSQHRNASRFLESSSLRLEVAPDAAHPSCKSSIWYVFLYHSSYRVASTVHHAFTSLFASAAWRHRRLGEGGGQGGSEAAQPPLTGLEKSRPIVLYLSIAVPPRSGLCN